MEQVLPKIPNPEAFVLDLKKEVMDKFFESLDGQQIVNSHGKIILTQCNKSNSFNIDFVGYSREDNRITLSCDNENDLNTINFDSADLTHPDLAGKGVFEGVVRLIAKNFPADFKLTMAISQTSTWRIASSLMDQYKAKEINLETFKDKLKKLEMMRIAIDAGFNKFTFFLTDDAAPITWSVVLYAEIVPDIKEVQIEIDNDKD